MPNGQKADDRQEVLIAAVVLGLLALMACVVILLVVSMGG